MVTTAEGNPVEVSLVPGSYSDTGHLRTFELDLPEGSVLYDDKASGEYFTEDLLADACSTGLLPHRKKNSTRSVPAYVEYVQQVYRKKISGRVQRAFPPAPEVSSCGHRPWFRAEGVSVCACLQHRCAPIGRNLGYTMEHGRARTRNEGTRSHRTLGLRTAPRERVQQVDPVRFDGTGPGDIAHWQNPTRSRRRRKGHRPDRPEACRNGNGSIWHRPRPSDTKCEVSMYMSAPLRSRKDDRH
ncbi:hypothetical protein GGQ07_003199 [Salinibacter ruber]|nr:hypothetical protein [Salinibacter ruber]MCS4181739.1 hypothetical protein [Salinibacter ruber]